MVIEHIGPEVWESCLASLAKGGRLITCGATTGAEVKVEGDTVTVRAAKVKPIGDYELIRKMRGSICILGPLLGRLRQLGLDGLLEPGRRRAAGVRPRSWVVPAREYRCRTSSAAGRRSMPVAEWV